MTSDNVLEEVKSRLDIVDFIADYMPLKRAGQNYRGLCPFHAEKTPSFMVSPSKQIFHCFGCGTGGDIFGFAMKQENLTFPEALRLLADKAGVKLRPTSSRATGQREAIKTILKQALGFYAGALGRSELARTYLRDRGITEKTFGDFSLGYAPSSWHQLHDHLKSKGVDSSLILRSGLFASGEKGVYDFFRARIMFPIMDMQGEPVAFGGRVLDEDSTSSRGGPKYLNSPDTELFKKGQSLYALDRAKEEIRKAGHAVVVEGYLDAIMCHQHGICNVVAPLGTALAAGQLRRLSRLTDDILLVFDGDEPGVKAAKRAVSLILEQGQRAQVLLLPEGEDPDSILRTKGPEHLRGLMGEASSPVDFILKSSSSGRVDTIKEAVEMISRVKDPILRDDFITELSERAKTGELAIREYLKGLKKGRRVPKNGFAAPVGKGPLAPEETLLLSAVLHVPEKTGYVLKNLRLEDVRDSLIRGIFQKMQSAEAESKGKAGATLDFLLSAAESDEERGLISRLSLKPGFDVSEVDKNIDDCLKKITKRRVDKKIKDAGTAGDLKLLNRLLTDRQKLMQVVE